MEKVAVLLTYEIVCGAVKEKMVFVLYTQETDSVLSVAMFAVFANAASVKM